MTLTLVPEDGTGKTNSNTYLSLSDAEDYFEGRLHVTEWIDALDVTRNAALVHSARMLDRYVSWHGWKSGEDQAMAWPRTNIEWVESDEIPVEVQNAQCELALVLLSKDTQALSETAGFKSISVAGTVTLEMDKMDRVKEIPSHVLKIVSHIGVLKGGSIVEMNRG